MEEPCVSKNSWENRSNENRTGHSPDLFCFSPLSLLGLYSCLALCISLGSRLFFAYPAQVHRCPAPPPLLNICSPSSPRARGSYLPRHPYDRLCRCLPSIWSKGTAAERSCVPASIAAWMRNGEKINIQHHQHHQPVQKDEPVGGQRRRHGQSLEGIVAACFLPTAKGISESQMGSKMTRGPGNETD